MKKLLSIIAFLILLVCSSCAVQYNHNTENSLLVLNSILYSAEGFFISIKESDFDTSWDLLSDKSKNKIVNEVYDASREKGVKIERNVIRESFHQNGIIARNFWNAARTKFDPDMVLEESKWNIGYIKNSKAEINITYKKSSRPSQLKMFKERDVWKVGLVETFWTRRYMESLFSFLRL